MEPKEEAENAWGGILSWGSITVAVPEGDGAKMAFWAGALELWLPGPDVKLEPDQGLEFVAASSCIRAE